MPIIEGMEEINKIQNFKLLEGYSAETSGGIFCMMKKESVKDFMNESLEKYG